MSDLAPVLFVEDEEEYLKNGVSVEEVFEISDEMLLLNTNNPEYLFKIFSLFHEYGMPEDDINLWFALNADFDVLEDIVNDSGRWEQIGIILSDHVDKYLAWKKIIRSGLYHE